MSPANVQAVFRASAGAHGYGLLPAPPPPPAHAFFLHCPPRTLMPVALHHVISLLDDSFLHGKIYAVHRRSYVCYPDCGLPWRLLPAGCQAVGSIAASACAGRLVAALGPRPVLALAAAFPLAVTCTGFLISEQRMLPVRHEGAATCRPGACPPPPPPLPAPGETAPLLPSTCSHAALQGDGG